MRVQEKLEYCQKLLKSAAEGVLSTGADVEYIDLYDLSLLRTVEVVCFVNARM